MIVVVSHNVYVFVVILADNELTGELPTELGDLRKLSVVDVRKFFCHSFSHVL